MVQLSSRLGKSELMTAMLPSLATAGVGVVSSIRIAVPMAEKPELASLVQAAEEDATSLRAMSKDMEAAGKDLKREVNQQIGQMPDRGAAFMHRRRKGRADADQRFVAGGRWATGRAAQKGRP